MLTLALALTLLSSAPQDPSPSAVPGPPPPQSVLTGRYAFAPAEPPFATAPDTNAIRERCLNGETAQGEALTACMSRIRYVENQRAESLNRLARLCREGRRLPNETVEACVTRREAAEAATQSAVVPLAPQLPVAEAWAEPRETCRRETRSGEGSASISFSCTTGGNERTREAARDMLDSLMGPR